MSSSNLKWVYGPTHRAQDVSNEAVDEYKSIVQQLYLDQNMTREEVLRNLQASHGFSLSANQFSKATKRWGFYKQPRQVLVRKQPPESITEEREAPNPHNPPEELFDFEPDVLDTILETETCFRESSETVADSHTLEDLQEQSSSTGMDFISEPPLSINEWQLKAMSVDTPCNALPCDTDTGPPKSPKTQLQQLTTFRKLQTGPNSIRSNMLTQVSFDNQASKKSRIDYLICCYLSQEALCYLELWGKSLEKHELGVLISRVYGTFTPYRRDEYKLRTNPNISLDMWSILGLLVPNQIGIPDHLLDRLDTNDSQFMKAVEACLELCKKWIELVISGLPRGALQFDSLLLQQNVSETIQNICRPLREQSRYDTWQEAGYLFAFVWSNEQREAAISSSWLKEADISGLSPTYFLAVMCRMIVHQTALKYPAFWPVSGKEEGTDKYICWRYLQAIRKIRRMKELRTLKEWIITYLFMHHTKPDIYLEEERSLQSVQSYQRRAERFAFGNDRDNFSQEVRKALLSHRDIRTSDFSSLASSRSTSSASYSSSYSYANQQYLTLLSSNPAMTRSLASGSSRGSSLNSFRAFQAASRAMEICLKEDEGEYI